MNPAYALSMLFVVKVSGTILARPFATPIATGAKAPPVAVKKAERLPFPRVSAQAIAEDNPTMFPATAMKTALVTEIVAKTSATIAKISLLAEAVEPREAEEPVERVKSKTVTDSAHPVTIWETDTAMKDLSYPI